MKSTTKILAFSCALIVSGYANASVDEAINAAEKARMAAAEVGYEWSYTALFIKQAKELAAKGKTNEAMQLAKKAEEEGKDALNQYHLCAQGVSDHNARCHYCH